MKSRSTLRGAALAAALVLTAASAAPAVAADVNGQGGGQHGPGKPGPGHGDHKPGKPGKPEDPGKPEKPGKPGKPDKPGRDQSAQLRKAVTEQNVFGHLAALQRTAEANGGNRAAGTPGYEAGAAYIEGQLRRAGYDPVRQYFSYDQYVLAGQELEQVEPNQQTYTAGTDYTAMSYSAAGEVTAAVVPVDINLAGDRASTSGCEAADFAGFEAGSIALLQRGTCDFGTKVANAAAAGAAAAVVFNQGNDVPGDDRFGLVNGTLGSELSAIPAVGATFALGEELAGTPGAVLRLGVDASVRTVDTFNILSDTRQGDPGRQVVVGAHLDSVLEGPGINDNGSGSAAILETAIQLQRSGNKFKLENQVRFAFWGGEEDGLVGSDYYVSQLDQAGLDNTLLNLNFDMVGSPNFVRFVYDGDGDAFGTAGPTGSDVIEGVFNEYFAEQGLATAPTEFDGRSDYYGFINNGIPAGGLFTGAEGVKTAEEAALFGGTAGESYDPCYHSACDDLTNINRQVLDEMSDAVAHATLTFAQTDADLRGGEPVGPSARSFAAEQPARQGHLWRR
ncbi:Aminopeptidase S [Arthrobacter saudimassiliensis]|uniref:Aminopeptidase S n=1 Tax=Arthrobacter saudimassiliensis TaxID=1461584 RepID=A0A078MQ70_9MICC|nr:Aminopeptidase S [Arthrobacter saudimassiliensis]